MILMPIRHADYRRHFPCRARHSQLREALRQCTCTSHWKRVSDSDSVQESIDTQLIVENIQTLFSPDTSDANSTYGPLFMPTLDPSSPCQAVTAPFVPENVTTRADLPDNYRNVIGLAPWVSSPCARTFLAASREQKARALIFYQPGNTSLEMPPPPESAVWGNLTWEQDNTLPVYAIPGPQGSTLMQELALYSGHSSGHRNNATIPNSSVPVHCGRVYGLLHVGKNQWRPLCFVGLAELTSEAQTDNLPVNPVEGWAAILCSLGVVVIGAIIFLIAVRFRRAPWQTPRRRRRSIRGNGPDGAIGGDIVLELRSRRPVVPQEIVRQLPMYIWQEPTSETDKQGTPENLTQQHSEPSSVAKGAMPQANPPTSNGHRRMFSQPMCTICLDEFVAGISFVRELPCAHIFHPECIDTFLTNESNACPLCKATVPPPSSEEVADSRERQNHRRGRLEGQLFKRTWNRLRALMRPTRNFHDMEAGGSARRPGPESQTQEEEANPAWRRNIQRRAGAFLNPFAEARGRR
ncbi:hypothetical protein VTN31DRAFT_1948 [Thermomyces dupontii]|uniref:uncharacterized protein n=1 Tax=Talaromyces thermophilus TaxID=28565 RepID=UPI003743D535